MKVNWQRLKFKNTSWVIIGLTLIIGIAVFINWQYIQSENANVKKEGSGDKILGEQAYVKSSDDDTYFDNARYTRQQSRTEAINVLKSIIDDVSVESSAKLQASETVNTYAIRGEKETSVENQIKAKGYSECIVFMGEDCASVVVQTDGLKTEEAAQIIDLVVSETGVNANVVKIIEIK